MSADKSEGGILEKRPAMPGDRDLRRRVRSGDEAAWTDLAESYHDTLYRKASLILGSGPTAEDAVGTTWLRAFKKARSYDPSRPPYPWLARICTNVCLNMRRKLRRMVVVDDFDDVPGPQRVVAPHDEEVHLSLREVLRKLPRREREVVTLRFLFGISIKEIAALVGLEPNSVQKTVVRGLTRLRNGAAAGELRHLLLALRAEP